MFAAFSCSALLLSGSDTLPAISITADRAVLHESDFVPVNVTVARSGPFDSPLRVFLRQSGQAAAGRDYTGVPDEVLFAAGEASVTFSIWPIDNSEVAPPKSLALAITEPLQPFSIALIPDTQYYTACWFGGVPGMFTSQTEWIVKNEAEWNIAFALHEGDCTDGNTLPEWQRTKSSMSVLDGAVPYAIAVGNHDGLMSARTETDLFNQFFPLRDYLYLTTFGQPFEADRMDNVYHTFTAGGVDWLVLSLEFGPRDEVLEWASAVVARNSTRKVMIVTHTHLYSDSTLHGSDPSHLWAPRSYGRINDGVDVWEKLVRKHANIAFVFNGHVLNHGQGRLVGIGDHGNRVYQMLCNYQMGANGGSGYMRVLKFFPEQDRFEVHSFSPYTGDTLADPANSFAYTNTGIFAGAAKNYSVDPMQTSVSITLAEDDADSTPPAIKSVSAHGTPAEILVSFDEPVDPITATTVTNYSVPGMTLASAQLLQGRHTVAIRAVTSLAPSATHSLSVTGVCDSAGNAAGTTRTFAWSPALLNDEFDDSRFPGWVAVDEGTINAPSEWLSFNGKLAQVSNIHGPNRASVTNRQGTFLVWDTPTALLWSNYTISARLISHDDDGIGLLFRYSNPSNYYKFEMDAQRLFRKLTKTVNGVETVLASNTNIGYSVGAAHTVTVELDGDALSVQVDGQPAFPDVTDSSLPTGTVALYAWANFWAGFDWVRVLPSYQRPVPIVIAPGNDDTFLRGTNVTIQVSVNDPEHRLQRLEVLDNGRRLHSFSEPPFVLSLSNVAAGDHLITARAVDVFGLFLDSPRASWHVTDPVPPPTIVLQPVSRVVAEGGSTLFAGRAESFTRLRYQWRRNGVPLQSATNSILWVEDVGPEEEGTYTLTAANISGQTQSLPATLTVVEPDGSGGGGTNRTFTIQFEAMLDNQRAVLSASAPPNATVLVEQSNDLMSWSTLTVLTNMGDRAYFTDALDQPKRFYRARLLP